jgi:hypothetical protein
LATTGDFHLAIDMERGGARRYIGQHLLWRDHMISNAYVAPPKRQCAREWHRGVWGKPDRLQEAFSSYHTAKRPMVIAL